MNYKYWIHFVKNLKKNAIGLPLNKLAYAIEKKQDWELTVAQIMNPLLPNSDLNSIKWENPLNHSGVT